MEILKIFIKRKKKKYKFLILFLSKIIKSNVKWWLKISYYLLRINIKFTDKNQKYLKIKLIILVKDKLNFSNMFRNCTSLKKVYLFSQKNDIIKNKNEFLSIVNKNDYDDIFYENYYSLDKSESKIYKEDL